MKEFLTKKDFPIRFPIDVKVFENYDLVDDLALQKGFKPIEPIPGGGGDVEIRDIQIYELLKDKDGVAHTSREASLTGFKDGEVHFVGGILSPDKSIILIPGEGLRAGPNNRDLHSGWISRLKDVNPVENAPHILGDQIKLLNLKVERILKEADCIVGFYSLYTGTMLMINPFAIGYTIYVKDSGK